MNDRILKFLTAENLSATQFADAIGVQRSGVSHIVSGRNKPSFDFIEKMLLAYPNVSADWLLLGKGAMYKNASENPAVAPEEKTLFAPPAKTLESAPAALLTKKNVENSAAQNSGSRPQMPANTEKIVERIAIFYSDKSVEIYRP